MSRVSRLCPIFRVQPGACPPETQKPDVAPPCGRTENSTEAQRSGFSRKRKCGKRGTRQNGKNLAILDAAARKQRESSEKAGQNHGVVRAPRRSHLPAVRAVSGICEDVPKAAKISSKALQYEKSPPFQGKRRGSNEKYGVKAKFALWITPECKQHVLLLRSQMSIVNAKKIENLFL